MSANAAQKIADPVRSLRDVEKKLAAPVRGGRKLDGMIFAAIAPAHCQYIADDGVVWVTDPKWWKWSAKRCEKEGLPYGLAEMDAPAFSTSIDAALTLVPEGYMPNLDTSRRDGVPWYGWTLWKPTDRSQTESCHDNMTIALCLAAIRARIAITGGEDD